MAGTIEAQKLRRQLKKVTAISTGLFMQFMLMPALGYASVVLFHNHGLTYAQSITLLIVCSSPGGTFSNLWCSLFNADLALSVAMTSFSSFLGIGALPANIALYTYIVRATNIVPNVGGNITKSVDFKQLATSLGLLIAGVALGLLFSYKLGRRFRRIAHVIGSVSGVILIALSAVFASVGDRGGAKPWNQDFGFYAGVGFPSVVGIVVSVTISSFLCKLPKPDIMTIAVECAFQNIAIAASAAFNIFQTKDERAQARKCTMYWFKLSLS
jgi:predicted Na+-dependent transporter